jgi:hypothetical protein
MVMTRVREPLKLYSGMLGGVYGSIIAVGINHVDLAPVLIGSVIGVVVGIIIGYIAEKCLYESK